MGGCKTKVSEYVLLYRNIRNKRLMSSLFARGKGDELENTNVGMTIANRDDSESRSNCRIQDRVSGLPGRMRVDGAWGASGPHSSGHLISVERILYDRDTRLSTSFYQSHHIGFEGHPTPRTF